MCFWLVWCGSLFGFVSFLVYFANVRFFEQKLSKSCLKDLKFELVAALGFQI